MKRVGQLYETVCSFENLHAAWRKARAGKTAKPEALAFEADLEKNLHAIRRRLVKGTWQPGKYRIFEIYEHKPRRIAAAPFRDRVVHHALVNVLEPIFEPSFIHDLHSNRKGRGTHAGMRRAWHFAGRHAYVLHADVQHYFPNIDRNILHRKIARKIKCPGTLDLCARILHIRQPGLHQGLPLGNQTSQFFANIYLSEVDHLVLERLKAPGYLRYVDDMFLFGDRKEQLWAWKAALDEALGDIGLRLKPNGVTLYRTRDGFPCLGYRVLPQTVLMRQEAVLRFRQRGKALRRDFAHGRKNLDRIKSSLMGAMGHFAQANTCHLRTILMGEVVLQRAPEYWLPVGEAQRSETPLTH